MHRDNPRVRCAYTLLELLVAVTTASAIFVVILTSGVAIYRSCSAAEDYSYEANEQLRAVDYVSRDLRGALEVSIPVGGDTLTVTLPDCYSSYDAAGIPTSAAIDPVIVNGRPEYGDVSQPLTVTYYVTDGTLIREQFTPSTGGNSQMTVATNVSAFSASFEPLGSTARFSLMFAPKAHPGNTALRPGTTVSATVNARKLRQKSQPAI